MFFGLWINEWVVYHAIYEQPLVMWFGKHWKEPVKAVTLLVFCWWRNDWTIIRWRTNLGIGEEPASRFDQERGDIK
jgi:hypothetical protein